MERIGKYEISGILGSGAFGRVYCARDPGVGRQVAIKMLGESADQQTKERFRTEAFTTAKLVHKNIITIYDYGDHEGNPYIVMEYLEGESLAGTISRLTQNELDLSLLSRLELLIQVAEGLEFAHRRSVIHRDIKPANLFRLPDGVVKILDFGIARLIGESAARMTQLGETAGTVLYMAPEQFRGVDADVLTDLFAFGGLGYELLTGEHPFFAEDSPSIIYRITSVSPDSLQTRLPSSPPRLNAIIQRALQKNRNLRYQSAGDIALDLREVIYELSAGEAARLFAEARGAHAENRWEDARHLSRRAVELDPVNAEFRKFRDDLQRRLQDLAVEAETTEIAARAGTLLQNRKYNEAIEALETAGRSGLEDVRLSELLTEARRRQKARREAAVLVAFARERLQAASLEEAKRFAILALEADGDNPDVRPLLQIVEAEIQADMIRTRIAAIVAEADDLRAVKLFEEGAALLAKALSEEGANEQLVQAQARMVSDRDAWLEKRARTEAHRQLSELAGKLEASGLSVADLSSIVLQLSTLVAAYPLDAQAQALMQQAEKRLKNQQKVEEIEAAAFQAESMRAAGDLEEADRFLGDVILRVGEAPELDALHRKITAELADKRRQDRLAAVVSQTETALAANDWQTALDCLEKAQTDLGSEEEIGRLQSAALAAKAASEAQARAEIEAAAKIEEDQVTAAVESMDAALHDKNFAVAVIAIRETALKLPHRSELPRAESKAWRAFRAAQVRQAVEDSTALLRAGRFSEAEQYLDRALRIFPDETTLRLVSAELNQRRASGTKSGTATGLRSNASQTDEAQV